MTDLSIAVAGLELTVLILGSLGYRAFMAWLAQREREHLSATDKAALEKRMTDRDLVVDGKLLELKNSALNRRT